MGRALKDAQESTVDAATLINLHVALSAVLHAWHQDSDFIDLQARPVPLRLSGKGKSVETLAARVGSRVPIEELLSSLKKQRLIRHLSNGKYVPTSARAQIGGDGPELSGYLAKAILHLLETSDINRRNPAKTKPLLERAAIVQDLSARDAEEFRLFSAEQGANLVASANAWLESRRDREVGNARRRRTVTAGLYVFAFVAQADKMPRS